jgi:hypothetical protein
MALLAWLAAERGELERAGRIWGAIKAEAARAPVGQWEAEEAALAIHVVREDSGFERGRAAGRRLTLEQVMDEVLAQPE